MSQFKSLISVWRRLPILVDVGFFLLLRRYQFYQRHFGGGDQSAAMALRTLNFNPITYVQLANAVTVTMT